MSAFLIALCSDPDGDLISTNLNGEIVGPISEAIVGAMIVMAPDTSETVELLLSYDDGTHFLAAKVTVNLDASSLGGPSVVDDNGQGVPGFSLLIGLVALIGAASHKYRKKD